MSSDCETKTRFSACNDWYHGYGSSNELQDGTKITEELAKSFVEKRTALVYFEHTMPSTRRYQLLNEMLGFSEVDQLSFGYHARLHRLMHDNNTYVKLAACVPPNTTHDDTFFRYTPYWIRGEMALFRSRLTMMTVSQIIDVLYHNVEETCRWRDVARGTGDLVDDKKVEIQLDRDWVKPLLQSRAFVGKWNGFYYQTAANAPVIRQGEPIPLKRFVPLVCMDDASRKISVSYAALLAAFHYDNYLAKWCREYEHIMACDWANDAEYRLAESCMPSYEQRLKASPPDPIELDATDPIKLMPPCMVELYRSLFIRRKEPLETSELVHLYVYASYAFDLCGADEQKRRSVKDGLMTQCKTVVRPADMERVEKEFDRRMKVGAYVERCLDVTQKGLCIWKQPDNVVPQERDIEELCSQVYQVPRHRVTTITKTVIQQFRSNPKQNAQWACKCMASLIGQSNNSVTRTKLPPIKYINKPSDFTRKTTEK